MAGNCSQIKFARICVAGNFGTELRTCDRQTNAINLFQFVWSLNSTHPRNNSPTRLGGKLLMSSFLHFFPLDHGSHSLHISSLGSVLLSNITTTFLARLPVRVDNMCGAFIDTGIPFSFSYDHTINSGHGSFVSIVPSARLK